MYYKINNNNKYKNLKKIIIFIYNYNKYIFINIKQYYNNS